MLLGVLATLARVARDLASKLPWSRSASLDREWDLPVAFTPAGRRRPWRLLAVLGTAALTFVSVLSLGPTTALFTSQAAPQSSSLSAANAFSSPHTGPVPPSPACHPVDNLASDPYFNSTTEGQTGTEVPTGEQESGPEGQSKLFEGLLTSASSTLPTGQSLPAGTVGLDPSKEGVSGSTSAPVSGSTFAFGYCDETPLSEFDPVSVPTSSSCPSGAGPGAKYTSAEQFDVCSLDNTLPIPVPAGAMSATPASTSYTNTGPSLPYVAIYAASSVSSAEGKIAFSAPPVLSALPVTVLYQSSNPTSTTFGGAPEGAPFSAVLSFSVAGDVVTTPTTGKLTQGQEYVAYLLVQDSDQSGPLADHLWYFQP